VRAPLRERHLLALDVDGVLIDPGRSFNEAVAGALQELAPDLPWDDDHYTAFKRVGGFNNDFRLTAAALALAERDELQGIRHAEGRGWPHLEDRIRELEPMCQVAVQKHYARSRRLERAMVTRADLDAFRGDLAIFTGRPPDELTLAFQVLGFRIPALADCAPHLRKPRSEGLLQLADAFRATRVTFVGDTCDDAAALRGARALCPAIRWTFAAVGPDRQWIAEEGDLRGARLRDLMPQLNHPDLP
jgi:phosphoglycolate phosphatase-like HAD superfamily hydrolase